MNQKILEKAREISLAHFPEWDQKSRCLHFSFLFERTKLLCMAQNSEKTHRRNLLNNTSKFDIGIKRSCSELNIFLRAKSKYNNLDWRRLVLVNVRVAKNGEIKNSRPCSFCSSLISYLSPKEVIYSTDTGDFVEFKN